jgi:hypothetical protein
MYNPKDCKPSAYDLAIREIRQLEQQRDELLALAKTNLSALDLVLNMATPELPSRIVSALSRAANATDAAIAKAEKGAGQ